MVAVMGREGADSVGPEELVPIQEPPQDGFQALLRDDGQQTELAVARRAHAGHVSAQIRPVVDEPLQPLEKARHLRHPLRLQRQHGEERDQTHHRAHLQLHPLPIRQMQHVVIERVLLVPEIGVPAEVIHGIGNINEMLEELGGHVLVHRIGLRQFKGDGQHAEAVHRHPAGAIRLFDESPRRQRGTAIENADVVEPQKSPLEHVLPLLILAVHPPGEVHQQLLEHPLQKRPIGHPAALAIDAVHLPCGPGMDGRIDIPEGPLVGRDLAVRVHVPLPGHQIQLGLGEVGIEPGQGDGMEGEVPGREPGVFPRVRHGEDIGAVQVHPGGIASLLPPRGRRRLAGIAAQPGGDVEVEELLAPEHAREGLALHGPRRLGHRSGCEVPVEGIGLLPAEGMDALERLSEGVGDRSSASLSRSRSSAVPWAGTRRRCTTALLVPWRDGFTASRSPSIR